MPYIRHDSHDQTTIVNQQALGEASPLETDADGYTEVEDEATATLLAAMDAHVSVTGTPTDDVETGDGFDAAAFVDRTPMGDVIADIETGDYDAHLDAIEAEASREGVKDAIDARRE